MIYTPLTKLAMQICFDAHKDATDKGGIAYVFHPWHVAEQMKDETTTVIALLHDVVEDTPVTLDDLSEYGFPQEIIDAIDIMTHKPEQTYTQYIDRIATNPLAITVKIADLLHNSDVSRLDSPDELPDYLKSRYKTALDKLQALVSND
ncbi:HD domain-containing protein [bacterium]|nr:HD domain-containing protein [bacterium]